MVDSSTSDDVECHDSFQGGPIEAGTNSAQAHMVPVRVSIISALNEFRFTINISVIVNLIYFFLISGDKTFTILCLGYGK
jgi:hypothetical protein